MAEQYFSRSDRQNWDHPARMPQRFGVGIMLLFLTLFSLAFFLLRFFGVPGEAILFLALLFSVVALAQILAPDYPRGASAIAGGIFTNAFLAIYAGVESAQGLPIGQAVERVLDAATGMLCFSPCTTIGGVLSGYLMGALLAGIFLRAGFHAAPHVPQPDVVMAELVPACPSDAGSGEESALGPESASGL